MKNALCTLVLAVCFVITAAAQNDPKQMTDKRMDEVASAFKDTSYWMKGGDLGLNLNSLGIWNPRLSDGANQFGFGGILNLFANNKKGKSFWDNSLLFQLGALRSGGKSQPFLKNGDLARFNTTWGYAINGDKLFVAIDGRAETQMMPTYTGQKLKAKDTGDILLSEFLSPVNLLIAPGLVYKPTAHLSFFASPVAVDFIYVGNDDLAALPNQPLGNEVGKNNRLLVGPALRAKYTNNYWGDRVALNSSLSWNGNYRDNVNGRALWSNQVNLQIFKGFGLKLLGEAFYDHYSLATLDKGETTERVGYGTTYRGGFFLTYAKILK